jgi:polar amino acid transport system substrate-binding protein
MPRTRHIAAVVAAAVSILALGGCGGGSNSSGSGSSGSGQGAATYGRCEVTGAKGSFSVQPTNPGVLTVQTNLPSPGWWSGDSPETIDGGYEYCMAATIAHRAGLARVGVVNVSFDALVAGRTDKFDIAMAQISITEERKKVVAFSAPYFSSDIGVLTKKGSGVTSDNIRGKRLGAAVGQTGATFLQDKIKPTTKPRIFNDTDSMNAAVASGQIDAAISDTAIVLAFAKQSAGALEVVGQYKTGEQYGALYPKGSANASVINQIIEQMRSDGTLDKLSQTWLGPAFGGDPTKVPYFATP